MHLLTTRSGELVSLVEPLCDDPGCPGCAGLVGLDSAQRVELATVADRPDMGATELVSALVAFLKRTGWADKDPEVTAEYALDMAAVCTEVARSYPLGTKVRAAFDRDTEGWTITCANQCDSNPPTGAPKASPLPATAAPSGRWAAIPAVVGGLSLSPLLSASSPSLDICHPTSTLPRRRTRCLIHLRSSCRSPASTTPRGWRSTVPVTCTSPITATIGW